MKIQKYINEIHKYEIDYTYQRPSGAWSLSDNQCFIDSIMRNEPIPMFFINRKSSEEFYIVDGQQRLDAIKRFYNNEFGLNEKFSGEDDHGKRFNCKDNAISDEQRESFLNYGLNFHCLYDYNDEKVRTIFSRLQRGKPLSQGEILNAKPGNIVLVMRELAKHCFIDKSIAVSNKRYGAFPDVARILFYEKHGCKDSSKLTSFFEENQNLSKDSRECKNIIKIFNFLHECFPSNHGSYKYFQKHVWVCSVYMMIKELSMSHSLAGKEKLVKKFIADFHNRIYDEDCRRSNGTYQTFYDNVRGGWGENINRRRKDILKFEFLKEYNIDEKDEKRQINDEQKITAFNRHSLCQICSKGFKDYKEPEYHHKKMYILGGKSEVDNIMVLCSECHKKIHTKNGIIKEKIIVDKHSKNYNIGKGLLINNNLENQNDFCTLKFQGESYSLKNKKDVLLKFCEIVNMKVDNFDKVLEINGGRVRYFSKDERKKNNGGELQRPKLINGTIFYVNTCFSGDNIKKACNLVADKFGLERPKIIY